MTSQLSRTRVDYERVHERLMQEVPQLVQVKADYLDICLVAVVKAQVRTYRHTHTYTHTHTLHCC